MRLVGLPGAFHHQWCPGYGNLVAERCKGIETSGRGPCRLRIGVDARLADYTVGGIARYTTQLVSAEMALGQDHSIITIRSRSPKVNPPTIPSSETLLARTPPHHRIERFSLPWELRNARLDVLHSPDCIPPRPGRWASVITVHDLAFLRMPRLLTEESRRYYGEIRRAVQEAKAIIAVSQVTADDLVRLAGARPEKVHVVHEAADSEMQPMPRDTAKSLVGDRFAIAAPYVLFVGTLEPRKNIPGLIQAFGHLRKDFPVRLVLAGRNGWLSEEIFTTVRSQALEDGVSFLGEVSPEELRTLYCAAEVLVLPSLYEGFGLPAVEAMACGTPVVVANTGALPEIVGEAGVLVRPDDPLDIAEALGWVLGNPGYREVLSARGIERAATFSWERAARETMAIYEQVAGG